MEEHISENPEVTENGTTFHNETIATAELPKASEIPYEALDRKYLTVSIISTTIFAIVLLMGWIAFATFTSIWGNIMYILISLIAVLVFIGVRLFLQIKGFHKKGYAMRDRDIVYRSGLIWHSVTAVPFNRIQHCSFHQGPVEKSFGLATIRVFTAGGEGSDLTIPGLPEEKAKEIKDFILKRTADHEY